MVSRPLHQAANSGRYEIYSGYRKALTAFDHDGSVTCDILFAKTKNGYTPSCQHGPNKREFNRINTVLTTVLTTEREKFCLRGDGAHAAPASSSQSQRLFRLKKFLSHNSLFSRRIIHCKQTLFLR